MPALDRKWWTLIAVCTATFMLLLDITVVNVALPSIERSLHSSFSDLQWVVDAYSLTLAAFLLTSGVLGDMFGRRTIFTVGLVIFSLSSLVCGLATSSNMLNFSRAVQGIGGAAMFATSIALIATAFHGKERGTAFGIYGAVLGAAVAVGPLIGGAITSGIGWRWIFFVNVPIGVVAVFITLSKIDRSTQTNTRRIDWIGFLTFSVSLFLLVLGLVRGNFDGWGSGKILGLLIGSAVLMLAFAVAEWLQKDPMLDLTLFKSRAFNGVSLTAFTLSASIFAMFLYLTFYIQDDLGFGPFQAGLRFLPITLMMFVVSPAAGKLTVRIHSRYLLGAGLLLVSGGMFLMGMTTRSSSWTELLPGFILSGIGVGLVNPTLASTSVAVVPFQRSGMASGANSTFRQIGIATGIAGLGAIFSHQIVTKTNAVLAATRAGQEVARHGGAALTQAMQAGAVRQAMEAMPGPAQSVLLAAYRVGFSGTLNELLRIGAVVALLGALLALALVRQKDFVPSFAGDGARAAAPSTPDASSAAAAPGAPGLEGNGEGAQPNPEAVVA
jgi:EmrB/QacA subfamily drug resistance transporter